jgi:N-glycosylase/DNA lyase
MKIPRESHEKLQSSYKEQKQKIIERLAHFESVGKLPREKLFEEFTFCIFTPQSKALACDAAVKRLCEKELLNSGKEEEIAPHLCELGVRFHRNKARYLVKARLEFDEHMQAVEGAEDDFVARNYLADNVLGFGHKEAGHFLRNIGRARRIAILDRHILKNLKLHGAIREIPKSLSRKKYFEIERKMQEFSQALGIDMQHVDLLFWSAETGGIFK